MNTWRQISTSSSCAKVSAEKHATALPALYTSATGTELFQQGTTINELWFLVSGLIKLVHAEPDGTELIIGLRFPGEYIGSAMVVANQPSPVTAVDDRRR
jgi:CRP-like cAMP-binding protein